VLHDDCVRIASPRSRAAERRLDEVGRKIAAGIRLFVSAFQRHQALVRVRSALKRRRSRQRSVRQRSRVRAPPSPPYIPKDLWSVWTHSDNQIWAQYGHNKVPSLNFEPALSNQLCPRQLPLCQGLKPSSLQPCSVRLVCSSYRLCVNVEGNSAVRVSQELLNGFDIFSICLQQGAEGVTERMTASDSRSWTVAR
jgi:hypothetical protein